jgi:hypothetical protein
LSLLQSAEQDRRMEAYDALLGKYRHAMGALGGKLPGGASSSSTAGKGAQVRLGRMAGSIRWHQPVAKYFKSSCIFHHAEQTFRVEYHQQFN